MKIHIKNITRSELTVGLILSLLRAINFHDREIRKGNWKKNMGSLLSSCKVGIIGFGRIGRRTAEMLNFLGASIVYFDPQVNLEDLQNYKKVEFNELLKQSDIVSLHLAPKKESGTIIGKKEISLMNI